MNLKLSLLYFTYRPGGFDMLCNSLKTQTYKNYELIVIDDLPNRDLTTYLEEHNIPLTYYGPSKKKKYLDTPFNSVNAINTGILEATGDFVIFVEDYAWLRPKSLDRWNHVLTEKGWKTMVTAVGEYWKYKPPERIDDITVWNEPFNGDFSSCTYLGTWHPEEWEFFYSAISMRALEELNGLDERLDYHREMPCLVWPKICKAMGLNFYVDDAHIIDLIDHRKWSTGEKRWWWTNYTATQPPKDELPNTWNIPALNDFNLSELNKRRRQKINIVWGDKRKALLKQDDVKIAGDTLQEKAPINYKLSLIYFTYRPGGFDLLCNSLKKQTYENYELIVVDDLPNRDLTDYIKGHGIPLTYYGPSKEKCYPDTPFGSANAINTGLLNATGEIVIIVEDYAWILPKSLERWNEAYSELGLNLLITPVGIEWIYKKPERIGDITVWNEEFTGDFSKCSVHGLWVPGLYRGMWKWGDEWDWHYSACPMEAWEKINGLDERFDYWRLYASMFFPTQVKAHGYRFLTDVDHLVYMINHRDWDHSDERWHINRTFKGEKKLLTEIYLRSPNCFDLRKDRKRS